MERLISYSLVFAVVALGVLGQLILKSRALAHASPPGTDLGYLKYLVLMFTDWKVLSTLVLAVLAAICWTAALQRLEIGYAYPFLALSFVLIPVGSKIFFGEPLPPVQLLGIALVIVGVSVSALAR